MVSATFDFDRRDIHVEALETLAQHLALDGDDVFARIAFHALEVSFGNAPGAHGVDVLCEAFKRRRPTRFAGGGHTWDMKY